MSFFFSDINDCKADSCQNGGICIDGINDFTCQCADGFNGRTCANSMYIFSLLVQKYCISCYKIRPRGYKTQAQLS